MMESGSEGEENHVYGVGPHAKPKRQMKTPFQLETLERAYAEDMYPSEPVRMELSEKLNLTDRQLQMWFCHRRLKDKKGGGGGGQSISAKKGKKAVAEQMDVDRMDVGDQYSEQGSGSGPDSAMESSPLSYREDRNIGSQRYGSSQWEEDFGSIVAAIERQLGEPLPEDGPILGIEFDSPPPGAFISPAEFRLRQRHYGSPVERQVYQHSGDRSKNSFAMSACREAEELYDIPYEGRSSSIPPRDKHHSDFYGVQGLSKIQKNGKQGRAMSPAVMDYEFTVAQRDRFVETESNGVFDGKTSYGYESHQTVSGGRNLNVDVLKKDRKQKAEDITAPREADEKRIRKELEKQEILRQKREEQLRKEMEKVDRERKKEEERLMREKQREEERILREQKRELERREKFMQRESLKAERLRQKEELRKEREALRVKAAMEKATARRIIRESMGLIEDERLELMELAVSSRGLESITSLDYDSLQNLESFRESLLEYPPKSLQLKKPFGVQPWADSDENIGNLLMVWRFFSSFTDILELWPFTLDEFVQAFHDYDSRLLGELHVALLKLIVKDIEDAVRASQMASGSSQAATVSPEGGHPHIVEGAYAWGFDINNWKKHLNAMTWPEILRQMALSAGFGPQLKKKKTPKVESLDDIKESKGSEDVVSILRNGSAAQNAIVKMQHRGLALPRKSRHRLTPGTVKFAAFHILSCEGSNGLTITELAERIQKYGLRDLSSSKKPEASIGVALTRDTILFERIAPSTYCVRPAYRKDPADAESVLAAAREKLQALGNTVLPVEDVDGVERDEDFECDGDADKVDDLGTPSLANDTVMCFDDEPGCLGNGNDNSSDDGVINVPSELDKDSSFILSNGVDINGHRISTELNVAGIDKHLRNPDEESLEVDESQYWESWVQGLAEGDYSTLSIEERLNVLVALIGLANEGNTIRAVLEARLEAANALKKQMWAEAEMDLKRTVALKNQKYDTDVKPGIGGLQSSMLVDETTEEQKSIAGAFPNENVSAIQEAFTCAEFASEQHKYAVEKSRIQLKSLISFRAEELYAYRHLPLGQDRRHNRYWQFIISASKYDPGTGRIFVESQDGHWRLIDTVETFDSLLSSLDTRGVRESNLHCMLKNIEPSFKGNLETKSLIMSLGFNNDHGSDSTDINSRNECLSDGDSPRSIICGSAGSPECSSSFQIELGINSSERMAAFRKYLEFEKWMWKECFELTTVRNMKSREQRCDPLLELCDICHDSYLFGDCKFHSCLQKPRDSEDIDECGDTVEAAETKKFQLQYSHLPFGVRLLKGLLAHLEAFIPPEALQFFWEGEHRKAWGLKLYASSTVKDLFKVLTCLEAAVRRECVSPNLRTTQEILDAYPLFEHKLYNLTSPDTVSDLPWVPQNTAAVALRVLEFEASIVLPDEDGDPFEYQEMPVSIATGSSSRYTSPAHNHIAKSSEAHLKRSASRVFSSDGKYLDSLTGNYSSGKLRRLRPGGKLQKSSHANITKASHHPGDPNWTADNTSKLDKFRTESDISGWGNQIVRGKRTVKGAAAKETQSSHHAEQNRTKPPSFVQSHQDMQQMLHSPENCNNAESDDDDSYCNPSESEHENWGLNFRPISDKLDGSSSSEEEEDINSFYDGINAKEPPFLQDVNIITNAKRKFNDVDSESDEDSD